MKIALVSDAWTPQVNGVVRTLTTTAERLRGRGHVVDTITPDAFHTLPCPTYPEIRLAILPGHHVARRLSSLRADAVHIATEGPLGWAARKWCLAHGQAFTTSFHTRFPDYLALRTGLPARWFWTPVRHFHRPAATIFVATEALAAELAANGLPQTHRWSRGVDLRQFSPDGPPSAALAALPRPILLHVGRVAVEKNIEAFLALATPGTKVVVGDGPVRGKLAAAWPEVRFLGALHGEALAAAYRDADVLVFPSRTDTFGLVMVEAMASGTPVAAYAEPHVGAVIGDGGATDADLATAVARALAVDRGRCAGWAQRYDWDRCTDQFVAGLAAGPPRHAITVRRGAAPASPDPDRRTIGPAPR